MEPVPTSERIELLDILRGFAIFGMFTVNLTVDQPFTDAFWDQTFGPLDRMTMFLVDLFTNGRFITLFSFLFGIGVFIQFERARARQVQFGFVYFRRLVGLFLIGSVVLVLGPYTDILVDYATYGLLLPFFLKRSSRFILLAAAVLFVVAKVPGIYESYQVVQSQQEVVAPQPPGEGSESDQEGGDEVDLVDLHRNGSLIEIVTYRARRLGSYLIYPGHIFGDLDILAIFLLGLFAGKRGLVFDERERKRFARKILPWLIGIGSICMIGFVYIQHFLSSAWDRPPLVTVKWAIGWPLGMVVVGLAYAAAISLVVDRPGWHRVLAPFAPVGRLALTNYLLTAIVGATMWYGWGFGLYDELMPSLGIAIVLVVFPVQMLLSHWWVKRFRFGPAEWFWRTMTYGKLRS